MTSMKHTVTLIADFEAPLVDIHITFERDFHCGPFNFQANFSRWLRPTNDNLFCGVTSLLNFDFYKVKFFTSLRILKLSKKGEQINTFITFIIFFRRQGGTLWWRGDWCVRLRIEESVFEPWPRHCVLFMGKIPYSRSAFLYTGVQMYTNGGSPVMDLHPIYGE